MNQSKYSRAFLLKSATIFAILCAILLIIGKSYAYWKTDSLSIEASLLDSCLDCIISMLNFIAVRHALVPADSDHGYGHGKAEALAGLLQALFIAGTALWLGKEVIFNFINPKPTLFDWSSLSVLIGAAILTACLVLWQKYVIRHTQSIAISADCLHYQTDLFTTVGVLLSVICTEYFKINFIDSITASIFSIYILKTSYTIGRKSFNILMDRELEDSDLDLIKSELSRFIPLENVHQLKTRSCGQRVFIQLNLSLDCESSLREADMMTDKITNALLGKFPTAEVVIQKKCCQHPSKLSIIAQ